MVRERNRIPATFKPVTAPSGTDNFGNLFRDPLLLIADITARELARRGFDDLRPALLFVATHVRADGSRITELAERSGLTKATVVRTVDELERLGYAGRAPDPDDGRAKLVTMTARGLEAERVGREIIEELRAAWAAAMEPGELDELERLLRRLRAALWDDEAAPGA